MEERGAMARAGVRSALATTTNAGTLDKRLSIQRYALQKQCETL